MNHLQLSTLMMAAHTEAWSQSFRADSLLARRK